MQQVIDLINIQSQLVFKSRKSFDAELELYLHSILYFENCCNVLFTTNLQYPHLDADNLTVSDSADYAKLCKLQEKAKCRAQEVLYANGNESNGNKITDEVEFIGMILNTDYILCRFVSLPEKTQEHNIYLTYSDLLMKEENWNDKIDEIKLIRHNKIQSKLKHKKWKSQQS